MRRRLIPMNVVMAIGLFTLISMGPDQSKPSKEMMERGKAVYARECLDMHQQDVLDIPGRNDSVTNIRWALGPKKQLIKVVLDNTSGQADANASFCINRLASLSHLTDQEIADVLTYVRNSFGNKAATVTPMDVKKVRLSLTKKNKTKLS